MRQSQSFLVSKPQHTSPTLLARLNLSCGDFDSLENLKKKRKCPGPLCQVVFCLLFSRPLPLPNIFTHRMFSPKYEPSKRQRNQFAVRRRRQRFQNAPLYRRYFNIWKGLTMPSRHQVQKYQTNRPPACLNPQRNLNALCGKPALRRRNPLQQRRFKLEPALRNRPICQRHLLYKIRWKVKQHRRSCWTNWTRQQDAIMVQGSERLSALMQIRNHSGNHLQNLNQFLERIVRLKINLVTFIAVRYPVEQIVLWFARYALISTARYARRVSIQNRQPV